MVKPYETLSWEDVEEVAESLFNVWVGQPEMAWAKRSWKIMSDAGLTGCRNESERHWALIRLLTLAILYHEFWYLGADEYYYRADLVMAWEEHADISRFRIGFLAKEQNIELSADDDDENCYSAIDDLLECRRSEVVRVLLKGFGDEGALFASLWCSNDKQLADKSCDEQEKEAAFWETSIEQVMTYSANKGRALEWITEGMSRLSP